MFATLATTAWSTIRRAAALLRAFALLQDGAVPARSGQRSCEAPWELWPTPVVDSARWTGSSAVAPRAASQPPRAALPPHATSPPPRADPPPPHATPRPPHATSQPPGEPGAFARDTCRRHGTPVATATDASAAGQLALDSSPAPHPHRRRIARERRARRPGTTPPAPMICLSPVIRDDPLRGDDRRR